AHGPRRGRRPSRPRRRGWGRRARYDARGRADGAEASNNSRQVLGRYHMSEPLRIALAQVNLLVGDVQGNAERVISTARRATGELRVDLVLFPELTLSGYPPEDLLFHRGFRRQVEAGLTRLR